MTGVDVSNLTDPFWGYVLFSVGCAGLLAMMLYVMLTREEPSLPLAGTMFVISLGLAITGHTMSSSALDSVEEAKTDLASTYGLISVPQFSLPGDGESVTLSDAVILGADESWESQEVTLRREGDTVGAFIEGQDGTVVALPEVDPMVKDIVGSSWHEVKD